MKRDLTDAIVALRQPRVSVIIVAYNAAKDLEPSLEAVLGQAGVSEVIVFDNASTDGTREVLKGISDARLKLMTSSVNLGVARAGNEAVRASSGEYLVFVEQDVSPAPGSVESLVRALVRDPGIGGAQGKLLIASKPNYLDGIGVDQGGIHYGEPADAFVKQEDILYPHGAYMIVRREAWEKIGGYDEDFFFGHEDEDIGWRLWIAGSRIAFIPDAIAYHSRGSVGKRAEYRESLVYWEMKGYILTVVRDLEAKYWTIFLVPFLTHLALNGITGLGRFWLSRAHAYVWAVRNYRKLRRLRRSVQLTRKRSDKEILGLVKYLFPPYYYLPTNWRNP